MPRNELNDIVSWQTGRFNKSTKHLLHALMTITSKQEESKIRGRMVTNSAVAHCSEKLILEHALEEQGDSVVCREYTCTINHKMDQSL